MAMVIYIDIELKLLMHGIDVMAMVKDIVIGLKL